MFNSEAAWNDILSEAQRHHREQLPWKSPETGKQYRVHDFTQKGKLLIWILRIKEGTVASISEYQVNNFISDLQRSGGRMTADRYKMPGARMDVAPIASIVHLSRWLDYEGPRGKREIFIRTAPKISIPGVATFSPEDEAQRQKAARKTRQGQTKFRESLRKLYNDRCCISGTAIEQVLDAAHIVPHSIGGTTEEANGLLLRTDIHNLFDDGLIQIHPDLLKIYVHPSLRESEYWSFHNKSLLCRTDGSRPAADALMEKLRLDKEVQ